MMSVMITGPKKPRTLRESPKKGFHYHTLRKPKLPKQEAIGPRTCKARNKSSKTEALNPDPKKTLPPGS